jgi:hypothetical protein
MQVVIQNKALRERLLAKGYECLDSHSWKQRKENH